MGTIHYTTEGTCSTEIRIKLDGDVVRSVEFVGGCTGNLEALAILLRGLKADNVARLFGGIQCRNGTSCPDQLAKALRQAARSKPTTRRTKPRNAKARPGGK